MRKFNKLYEGTSLARTLLDVDILQPGFLPRYPIEKDNKSYVSVNDLVTEITDAEELFVPTYKIDSENYDDRNLDYKEIVHKKEDKKFFALLFESIKHNRVVYAKEYSLHPIILAMNFVEDNDTEINAFICSRRTFRSMSLIDHKHFYIKRKGDNNPEYKGLKVAGSIFNIPIFIHESAKDYFFVLGDPEDLGVMAIRYDYQESTEIGKKNKKNSPNKHVIEKITGSEEVGIAILNDKCVSAVKIIFDNLS